jgi:internalin A
VPAGKRAQKPSSISKLQSQIDEVLAGRTSSVDLSIRAVDQTLTEVPDEIAELEGLRTLVVGDNLIFRLPSWLEDLPHLERIDTLDHPMTDIPSLPGVRWGVEAGTIAHFGYELDPAKIYAISIRERTPSEAIQRVFDLGRRQALRLSDLLIQRKGIASDESDNSARAEWPDLNVIDSQIDEFLESQQDLSLLSLFGCPLGRIPEPIRELKVLAYLDLAGVWPGIIPYWLFEAPALTSLDLALNGLTHLPESLGRGLKLKALYLFHNPLTKIPAGIWRLKELETLDLRGCPVTEIPADILRLKRLTKLVLDADKVVAPPPEIAANGLEAIKRYWSQLDAGVDFLAEAKLLIVGEAGAGKTSLAKKILDPSYALDAAEDSTEGINVLAWPFPASIRVRDENGEHFIQRDFRVNIWDFGGQEIYHSTHQFFLTKRSVYVLVTDERKEDTDFEYWLEVVNLLSEGSPLVIVQNRKQGRQQGIDFGALRQRYLNLRGTLALDLADNSGLEAAVAKIRQELEQLPHIGTSLPKTWRDVRLALEGDPRNYIPAAEFFEVCQSNGFTDQRDMLQLGGYLHDLGICLFFQDDPLLSKTVILKPEWGTGAVYRVLDDPEIARCLGVFQRVDLQRTWSDAIYESMRDELLQLMVKFGLCFQVPGSDTYIAPQLLTPSQPTYDWDETDNLVLRYEYEVMPKGIVRRLIVALHDLITRGDFLWRNGVIFAYDASRAEVIEQYRRRVLSIRIQGGDPRVLLGVIEHALAVIHRSYPGIKVEKFMPCNCPRCSTSSEPSTFAVSELLDFASTGDQIQCRASRKLLDPVKLLSALVRDIAELQPAAEIPAAVRHDAPVQKEVFISYKWGAASGALVDEIQSRMEGRGVLVTRDKDEIRYRDSIEQFMRRIGAGKYIIVVLSHEYLRSKNCMFELTEIARHPEFASRVYPVVMKDAAIFDSIGRIDYIKYWEGKQEELNQAMKQVRQENLKGIRDELELYAKIRSTIDEIMAVLANMNTLIPETHLDTDFEQLYAQLTEALA